PEHPRVAAGSTTPKVHVVVPRISRDTDHRVLKTCVDVSRAKVRLESRPASDLALETVRADDDLRAYLERLGHVLASRPDDLSVVSEESDGARLDQNLRACLRGLFREIPVEQVALEDVTAFVPRASLIDDEGGPVWSNHADPLNFVTDELPGWSKPDFVQPSLRDTFPTTYRRPALGPSPHQYDTGAS